MVRFTADVVTVDDSDDAFILIRFASERGEEPQEALHFQRSHEFDSQDRAAGIDAVYVERHGQRQGAYGAVRRAELSRRGLTVHLEEAAARRLGDDTFEIDFGLSAAEFERLQDGLRAVFRGVGLLTELPG